MIIPNSAAHSTSTYQTVMLLEIGKCNKQYTDRDVSDQYLQSTLNKQYNNASG